MWHAHAVGLLQAPYILSGSDCSSTIMIHCQSQAQQGPVFNNTHYEGERVV